MQNKCYLAEGRWRSNDVDVNERYDFELARDLIKVLSKEFGVPMPTVQEAKLERGLAGVYHYNQISFPAGKVVHLSTILHEFAHHLHRHLGYQGRAHGGGYIEAMLTVVSTYLGEGPADDLRAQYEKVGLPVTQADEMEHVARAAAVADRLRDRVGETGKVYVVSISINGGPRYFIQDANTFNRYAQAGAWRRRSTAEKYAGYWHRYDPHIHEVDGVFEQDETYRYNTTPKWVPQDKALTALLQELRSAK